MWYPMSLCHLWIAQLKCTNIVGKVRPNCQNNYVMESLSDFVVKMMTKDLRLLRTDEALDFWCLRTERGL